MLILALESSTDLASCALWHDGRVSERMVATDAPSSATLLPAVGELLATAGVGLDELDAVAFAAGPGSFTGLRIACGLAQGLAFAAGVPVVPVNTLAVIASACPAGRALVLLDARMHEVYFGLFACAGDAVRADGDCGVAAPAAVPIPAAGDWIACGNALAAYPVLAERLAGVACFPGIGPSAARVAALGACRFADTGGIDPELAGPIYVRDKVALTVAERLAAGGRA